LSLVIFLIYSNARNELSKHLVNVGFGGTEAASIARFSTGEVGWFVLFLLASVGAVYLIQSGALSGRRAKWAGVLLGLILVVDMARANAPWIRYYDYKEKYASNPIVEILKDQPHTYRIAMPPFQLGQQFGLFQQIYHVEWMQHLFPYYNVQSLDIPQEPRISGEKAAYLGALSTNMVRLWELANVRYLGGMAGNFATALNQQFDPVKNRFRVHTAFNFFQKPGKETIGVEVTNAGPYALIEFTGVLPRAKLFAKWQVMTNGQDMLARLANPAFDPTQTVLVSDSIEPPAESAAALDPGTVDFLSYAPKRIELKATATAESILLLNDKFDPGWKVSVDGHPADLLRCNYLMRGVRVPVGTHTVTFSFSPSNTIFYVSLAAVLFGLVLCVLLVVIPTPSESKIESTNRKRPASTPQS
jgi:hypothetical protein